MFKFADVSRPAVFEEHLHGIGLKVFGDASIFLSDAFDEVVSQDEDVIAALVKGRNEEFDDMEAEVKVFAEMAFADGGFEVSVGCSDKADIGFNGGVSADAFERMAFEDAEKFGLDREAHFADFVEEEGALIGGFELADLSSCGTGEGAFFVTEEFAFKEGL